MQNSLNFIIGGIDVKKILIVFMIGFVIISNTLLNVMPALSFDPEPAIVNPTPAPGDPSVTPRVIVTCSRQDFDLVCGLSGATDPPSYVWDCPLRHGSWSGKPVTIVGPLIGAPHTIMVVEKLIVLGARMILYFGYTGSLQSDVRIGDLVVPTSAVSGEGTSKHYYPEIYPPLPDSALVNLLNVALSGVTAPVHQGAIWSNDAIYRETVTLVQYYQNLGVKGVDMEMSAFFTLGKFRDVAVAGLLAVSDELFTYTWNPGFDTPIFQEARNLAARAVLDTAAAWNEPSNVGALYLLLE
jgi:uridine phosphorylase